MKKAILYIIVTIIFFVIYWGILKAVWDQWVPWNINTDIIGIFSTVFIIFPLAVFTSNKCINYFIGNFEKNKIRENKKRQGD